MNLTKMLSEVSVIGLLLSLMGFELGIFLKSKAKRAWLKTLCNPLLIAIIFVIGFLQIFNISYETYESSARYISFFLTPATICLAVPLYEQINLLKRYFWPLLISLLIGVITGLSFILALSKLLNLTQTQYITLLPKSITTAIGIGLSQELGGVVSLTVSAIILTGILGNIVAEFLCKQFKIKSPISQGLAIGTAAHVVGTAKAMEIGELEGAMSSLALVIVGILTALFAGFFAGIY